jgi:murein DD-endopeptidase MepM/ murein hydrolase activator NlpD
MTPALDSLVRSARVPPLRLAQAAACLCVAIATLQSARQSIRPAPPLGQTLFPAGELVVPSATRATMELAVIDVIVQRDDTLDHIFRRLQISLSDLADIRALSGVRELLDRLNPGEHLKFLQRDGALVGLDRHVSLTEKLEVRRSANGFEANVIAKQIQTQVTVVHAVIESSLFESANAAGLSDSSVLKLAKILGSDIDFVLGLRPGDEFTVEYQRLSQNDQYVKDGEILAVRFINQGHEYVALRYAGPDGAARYYSPDGHSMQKAFLRAPLEFRRISSGFSLARRHPILNLIRAHQGTDYAAPLGTPVYAAGSGRITFRGVRGGYGNAIEIDHGGGIVTVYGHMSRFAALKTGTHVQQGETIGYVGMTGLATGPHLHFEFHMNGRFVDPQKVKLPDAGPIDPSLRADFERTSTPLLQALNGTVPAT